MYLERVVIGAERRKKSAKKLPSVYDNPVSYQEDELEPFSKRFERVLGNHT